MRNKILYLSGDSNAYRCDDCGCNVFNKITDDKYKCNGCGATYLTESEAKEWNEINYLNYLNK